jgi:hypothetical protein
MGGEMLGAVVSHKFVGYGLFQGKVVAGSGDTFTVEWEDGCARIPPARQRRALALRASLA